MNFFIKFFDNYAKICLGIYPLRKKYKNMGFLWPVFSGIRTES